MGVVNAPTGAPVATGQIVEITPFLIEYSTTAQTEGRTPTARDFSTAADVTQSYLEAYLLEQFGTDVESFEPVVSNFAFDPVWGVVYSPTITFSSTLAPNYPSVADVDMIVRQAFSDPAVTDLINELQALSPTIVFQTTNTLQYSVYSGMLPEISTASPSPLPIILTPVTIRNKY